MKELFAHISADGVHNIDRVMQINNGAIGTWAAQTASSGPHIKLKRVPVRP